MIEISGVYLKQLPNRHALISLLNPSYYAAWRTRHKSVRDELAARASLGGLFLLQRMGYCYNLEYDTLGRPCFRDSKIDFNITHTQKMILCAVERPDESASGCPPRVGIDAEDLARIVSLRICPLAERWFTAREHEIFLTDPTDRMFLQIWTRKESLIKWTGEGIRALRRSDVFRAEELLGVSFREYEIGNTMVSLCHRAGTIPPSQIHMLTNAQLYR